MFKEATSCDNSRTRGSTSRQLPNDQQMGANNNNIHHDSMLRNQHWTLTNFWCSQFNLNAIRIIMAEVLGTFILVFSICGMMGSMQLLGDKVGLMEYATTAGAAIVVIIFTLGEISGAHVNPAVTIAFALFGHFPWVKVPFYVVAQILGSILGTNLGELVFRVKPDLIMTVPLKDHEFAAFIAELIATSFITFLATSLGRDARTVGHLGGLVLSIAIALAVLVTGPLSGGSLNPARSLRPAILACKIEYLWIYLVAPIAGAILGVLLVHALCIKEHPQSHNSLVTSSVLP